MKIQREKEALEHLEAVENYVNERLTDARLKAQSLKNELAQLEHMINVLKLRADSLKSSKLHWITPISPEESVPPGTTPIDSVQAIQSILETSIGPMRVGKIAEYAHAKGLITSSRGLKGVVSIVSNKVSQHSPKLFTNTGWGWWDLTSRTKVIKVGATMNVSAVQPKSSEQPKPDDNAQAGSPTVEAAATVH